MFVSTQAIVWSSLKTQKGLLDLTVIYLTMMTLRDISDMDRKLLHMRGASHTSSGRISSNHCFVRGNIQACSEVVSMHQLPGCLCTASPCQAFSSKLSVPCNGIYI